MLIWIEKINITYINTVWIHKWSKNSTLFASHATVMYRLEVFLSWNILLKFFSKEALNYIHLHLLFLILLSSLYFYLKYDVSLRTYNGAIHVRKAHHFLFNCTILPGAMYGRLFWNGLFKSAKSLSLFNKMVGIDLHL